MQFFRLFALFSAAFLFLALPAVIVYRPVDMAYGLLWAGSIFAMSVALFLAPRSSKGLIVIFGLLAFGLVCLNLLLSASYSLQQFRFNEAFFSHFDLKTALSGFAVEPLKSYALLAYLVLAPVVIFVALLVPTPPILGRWQAAIAVVVFAVSVVSSYPLNALVQYNVARNATSERLSEEIAAMQAKTRVTVDGRDNAPNLVLIYLEGVEQSYLDEDRFPGLLPRMSTLQDEGVTFTEIVQFPGTSWTIAGMVATQCGVPLLTEGYGNTILEQSDNPFAHINCLAEILNDVGYHTIYMGGARLSFAGKGAFLTENGYAQVLGVDEMPSTSVKYWGLYDSALLINANRVFDALADSDARFLFSMLTLDTHPAGNPSPGCEEYPGRSDRMLQAVHCSDQLIYDFVRHVQASPVGDNTVIVLVSDHLMQSANHLDELKSGERRLIFTMLGSGIAPERVPALGTHFDIGPTILDALGFANVEMPLGHSLLKHNQGFPQSRGLTEDDIRAFRLETLIPQ